MWANSYPKLNTDFPHLTVTKYHLLKMLSELGEVGSRDDAPSPPGGPAGLHGVPHRGAEEWLSLTIIIAAVLSPKCLKNNPND